MKSLCVIPARGGSKRIPRKNIKPFFGKPLIAYSIEAAKSSGLFDRIVVSTDDAEITEIARHCGAEVPFVRPESLSNDMASSDAVIKHAIEWYLDAGNIYEFVCAIYPTAPLLRPDALITAYETLKSNDLLYVFSVTDYAFPIQRALKLSGAGVEMFSPEYEMTRSQDLEPAFHDAGQFYWGRAEAYLMEKPIFAPHSAPFFLPRAEVIDIDTPDDWDVAERQYSVFAALKTSLS